MAEALIVTASSSRRRTHIRNRYPPASREVGGAMTVRYWVGASFLAVGVILLCTSGILWVWLRHRGALQRNGWGEIMMYLIASVGCFCVLIGLLTVFGNTGD